MTIVLDDAEHCALLRAAEWFLPPNEQYPTFAAADPNRQVLALVLDQLVPLETELRAALAAIPEYGVADYLDNLPAAAPDHFDMLRTLCLGWYFTCRPVWHVLGYTGRRPIPIRAGEAEEYLSDGLLAPVVERGKIYRTV